MPLSSLVVGQMMAIVDLIPFATYKNVNIWMKKAQNGAGVMIYLSEKNILGLGIL